MIRARIAPLIVLVLALLAGPTAFASGPILVGWGTDLEHSLWLDCDSSDEVTLFVYFLTGSYSLEGVTQLRGHVDFCTLPNTLPDYFRFESGGCREGALEVVAAVPEVPKGLVDPWGGQATVEFEFIPEHYSEVRARIDVVLDLPDGVAVDLDADTKYFGFAVRWPGPHNTCNGCQLDACFVINDEITFVHDGGETHLYGNDFSNHAYWRNGPGCPFIISVDPMTWGRTKAQYRK